MRHARIGGAFAGMATFVSLTLAPLAAADPTDPTYDPHRGDPPVRMHPCTAAELKAFEDRERAQGGAVWPAPGSDPPPTMCPG